MLAIYLAVVAVIAYLIGGIPVGAIIAHFNHIDISQHGSGKTGTTNVLRAVGKRAAALVLIGDFLKGTAAVLAARMIIEVFSSEKLGVLGYQVSILMFASVLAAAAAVAGHIWSIYLRIVHGSWKGGRGIVTALGAVAVVSPWILLAGIAVGLPTVAVSRYVSLGSIVGVIAASLTIILLVLIGQMDPLALLFLFLSVLVIAAHRDNIERLLKGTERKLGERAKA